MANQAVNPYERYKAVCPHAYCRTMMQTEVTVQSLSFSPNERACRRMLRHGYCSACNKLIVLLTRHYDTGKLQLHDTVLYPTDQEWPLPREVTGTFREDFTEAYKVLTLSPKASAALSRRSLQHLLIEKAGAPPKATLDDQIKHVLKSGELPPYLRDALDDVRKIGNLAAHPNKSEVTGLIVDVEPGEAMWNLETINKLFDFYIVQPKLLKDRKAALQKKLNETK